MYSFKYHTDAIVVENPMVEKLLKKIFPSKNIYTVYNTCNPIFFDEKDWNRTVHLPEFFGKTILTLASYYPHKNLEILVPTAHWLKKKYPDFLFRFVMSIRREQLNADLTGLVDNFIFLGSVSIDKCPWIYKQSDIMLLPTQLECFSASWVEAMVMRVPIITSDLPFAHGICEDAATYVDPNSPEEIADTIYGLSHSSQKREHLINNGDMVSKKFSNANTRMSSYLKIIKSIV